MVEISRLAAHDPTRRINLTLLKDPTLGAADNPFRSPFRERPFFQNEAGGEQGALRRVGTRNDVARENVRGVWIGITEEESEGDDGPRIAVMVVRPLAWKSTTCTNVKLTRTSESLRRTSLPTTPVVRQWEW